MKYPEGLKESLLFLDLVDKCLKRPKDILKNRFGSKKTAV